MRTEVPGYHDAGEFRHEALMYRGHDDFVSKSAAFIRDSLAQEEPILVVVSGEKIDMLRSELGSDADGALFSDMREVGKNPARIIPAWRRFVTEHSRPDGRLRGIGEPIWASRSPDELIEAQRHEALLNLAFSGAARMWLLCPYDTSALDTSVIDEAHRTHPYILDAGTRLESRSYPGLRGFEAPFDQPLPPPNGEPLIEGFSSSDIDHVREVARKSAVASGLGRTRQDDFVLAVHELATNSIKHGGGGGTLMIWSEAGRLLAEVQDGGYIDEPLVGRRAPQPSQIGRYGLWLINQLCDLVQIRSAPGRTSIRIHMRRD